LPRPWPQTPEIGLGLGIGIDVLASVSASASRFWPRLTSLVFPFANGHVKRADSRNALIQADVSAEKVGLIIKG